MSSSKPVSDRSPRVSRYLKVLLLIGILILLHYAGLWLAEEIRYVLLPEHKPMIDLLILGVVLVYILFMAMPFMPGIELGLGLMMLFGSKGAVLVYFSTLIALSISYLVGRTIPSHLIARFLQWLHLDKARSLVLQLEPLDRDARVRLLQARLPAKLALFLVNHRYLTIAVALNVPGNALIGGGGGIGLVAGMSRIIPYWGYLLLLVIVVAPIPLWFYLFGR